jgi:hypothetical protein
VRIISILSCLVALNAYADVSIDPDAGIIKGLDTGLNYDRKAEVLYDDDGVIESDIKFTELLFDCTVEAGGQVCADIISGTYGFHDFGMETYANPDFWVDYKSAYYEPLTGGWLDANSMWTAADAIVSVFSEAERALFSGWRFYEGDLGLLVAEMAVLESNGVQFSTFRPTQDVSIVHPPVTWKALQAHGSAWPKDIPPSSVMTRFDNHCKQSPRAEFVGTAGITTIDQLRSFVKARFDVRESFMADLHARAAVMAAARGETFTGTPWPRQQIEQPFLEVVDGLESVYIFTQRNAGSLTAVALANFRGTGSNVVLDWWATAAEYAETDANGNISVGTHARGNVMETSALFGLAYSNACVKE